MFLQQMNEKSELISREEFATVDACMNQHIDCYAVILDGDPAVISGVECVAAYRNGVWSLTKE